MLFVKAWFFPLLLVGAAFLVNYMVIPSSTLLIKSAIHPYILGPADFLVAGTTRAGLDIERISFGFTLREHQMLVVRFNQRGTAFDLVRISGIEQYASGIFHFNGERIETLQTAERFETGRNIKFVIELVSGTLNFKTDGRIVCSAPLGRMRGPVNIFLQDGQPFAKPLRLKTLELQIRGADGVQRTLRNTLSIPATLRLLRNSLIVAVPLLLLAWLALALFCPPRWLEDYPRRSVLAFGGAAALFGILLGVLLVAPVTKRLGVAGDWYGEYMKWGSIDEEILLAKRSIYNGKPFPLYKGSDYRIVVMGGSSTFGDPLNPGYDQVYTNQLDMLLKSCHPQIADRIEVVNLGSQSDSFDYNILQTYEKVVLAHMRPDLVVINCVVNNYMSTKKLFNIFHFFYLRAVGSRLEPEHSDTERYRENLQRLLELARERNVKLLFVEEPLNVDYFFGENIISDFQQVLRDFCRENDLPLVEAQTIFEERRDEFLFYDFVHLTYLGNRLMAERIFDKVQGENLLGIGACGPSDSEARAQSQPSSD
ncbi:MAG: SGNH/GDSL hydrolase family protein [Candidatus Alcyoniella australis]|nr:SGNH/GDSL hydrolase family protein [Candidatus Alcyoniella australis]